MGILNKHLSDHRAVFCCYITCIVRDVKTKNIDTEEKKTHNMEAMLNGPKEISSDKKLDSTINVDPQK